MLRGLLADSTNINKPEIARGSCIALLRLEGENSIDNLIRVLSHTDNPRVFSTAAYCLKHVNSTLAMVALVDERDRFPDTGAAGFNLVDMEDTILNELSETKSPHLIHAVHATEYLWGEGQCDRYLPLLKDLLAEGPIEDRAVDR